MAVAASNTTLNIRLSFGEAIDRASLVHLPAYARVPTDSEFPRTLTILGLVTWLWMRIHER